MSGDVIGEDLVVPFTIGEAPEGSPSSLTFLPTNEQPPGRLDIRIQTPSGRVYHLTWADPNPENVPSDLETETTMPGGFSRATFVLQRDPCLSYPDLELLSTVTVLGVGGQVAWEGRIDKLPETAGYNAQVTVECVGWQAALEDDDGAREVFVDRELSKWEGPSTAFQVAIVEGGHTPSGPTVGAAEPPSEPSLVESCSGPWEAAGAPFVIGVYNAQGIPLASLFYAWECGKELAALEASKPSEWSEWSWYVGFMDNDHGGGVHLSSNLRATGKGASTFAAEGVQTYARVKLEFAANTPGGAANITYAVYWTALAVYGTHGLTKRALPGEGTQAEAEEGKVPGGLLASDVVAYAVSTWAPTLSFSTGPEGTILPSSFVIPHLTFLEATTAAEMVKQAARFELLDWAVWEGQTFWMNERGARGKQWRARTGPAQLQEAGAQVARLWNGAIVEWTDGAGTNHTVGPIGSGAEEESAELEVTNPENPANEAGLKRYALVKAGTTSLEGAKRLGQAFLAEQAKLEGSGQATLIGSVEDNHGVFWPSWMVRAGDEVSFVDAANTAPRRIASTSYSDSTRANTIQLEVPPDTFQAILERMSVVLTPLGL